MKGISAVAALAAASSVLAAPSVETRQSKIVPITVKGNGEE